MKKKRSGVREIHTENAILDYLALRQVFAWKARTVGTWDQKRSVFRARSRRYMVGISDIVGIYRGKPLAIEVKTGNGYLRPDQKKFLHRFNEAGGIAIVARSVEEVAECLDEVDRELNYDTKHVHSVTPGGENLVPGVGSK